MNHPADRLTDRPTDRPTDQPTDRPTDRTTDQPTNQPTDQSINQSIQFQSRNLPELSLRLIVCGGFTPRYLLQVTRQIT